MPKLFWVTLPLLLFAAIVAAQALRRRPPSRQALNAWSSVLLLGYVLTTASLGIFWVANQQLPVFDWHYLFGYGTVLLVTLHLWFNFRSAWKYFTRPRKAAAPDPHEVPERRGALAALGLLAAAGVAFALGMRHGRSELRVEGPPAGGKVADPAAAALGFVERFHDFSSHSRAGVLLRAPGVDWGDPPPSFKRYPNAERVLLPVSGTSAGKPFHLAALGAALWHTSGVSEVRSGLKLRTSPSSGALFSTELYVVSRSVIGLAPGLWHHDAEAHALERLQGDPPDDAALGAAGEPGLRDAAAVVVATAIFRRSGHKYRDRTYRYVLADLGHALENLRVAAAAAGLEARFVAGFDESRAAATLGIEEREEGVLALTALHAAPPGGLASSSSPIAAPLRLAPTLFDASASPLGVTAAVHVATSLRAAGAAAAPASLRLRPAPALPPGSIALPSARPSTARVLDVIAARRSVRRFAPTPLPLDAFAAVLKGTALQGELLSAAVRLDVVVHGVAGIAQGAYRYDSARHVLVPRGAAADLRAAARAAALDQDVIGDAAAVFVLSIDRAVMAADPLGPARGYRHAFLEAGLIGERIYLEGGARGLGVCGVGAFYDAEAAALVAVDPGREWVVHFAALGVPSS